MSKFYMLLWRSISITPETHTLIDFHLSSTVHTAVKMRSGRIRVQLKLVSTSRISRTSVTNLQLAAAMHRSCRRLRHCRTWRDRDRGRWSTRPTETLPPTQRPTGRTAKETDWTDHHDSPGPASPTPHTPDNKQAYRDTRTYRDTQTYRDIPTHTDIQEDTGTHGYIEKQGHTETYRHTYWSQTEVNKSIWVRDKD